MKRYLSAALLFLCSLTLSAETHVLTDIDGRTIECQLIDYKQGYIAFSVEGKRYSLPLSRFSETSRRAVLDWVANQVVINGDLLVKIEGPSRQSGRDENNDLFQKITYTVGLSNRSQVEIDGIEIQYKLYWLDGRVDVRDGFYFWTDHVQKVGTLKVGQGMEFTTSELILKDRANRKDSVIGVWVRIYRNGVYLKDYADPNGLITQQEWRNFSLDAIR